MRPLWLCWALWVLPLAGSGTALTGEQLLGSLLQQLQLSEAPVLDRADMEELVIPAHVRAQYVTLLQRSHGDRSRGKRFSQSFRGEALPPCCPWSHGAGQMCPLRWCQRLLALQRSVGGWVRATV
ncbi:left-right determination factor 1-like [Chlorocebus sabaeus]|uniref:left-right determination factor 1-like n=1 Tax=Chlorocebus sabaeus TaxID=60711 RepID=UPI003BF9E7D8